MVTRGDIVFQAAGSFHALDARSGQQRWMWKAPEENAGINGDPMSYQIGGTQFVSIAATNSTLYTFALP